MRSSGVLVVYVIATVKVSEASCERVVVAAKKLDKKIPRGGTEASLRGRRRDKKRRTQTPWPAPQTRSELPAELVTK